MIGVIADDLTGAAEIAGIGWRHGLRAEIFLTNDLQPTADLVCIDTDSRSSAPEEAAQRAAAAAKILRAAGAKWIYKKVDSVLRGQVTPEIEAILAALGMKTALLVPANPSLGRVIREGRYFVGGKPIDETEFARDPAHPRTSSRVLELLAAPRARGIRVARVGEPVTEGEIVVGEVESADEVASWAATRRDGVLASGGAEFFAALLRAERGSVSRCGVAAGSIASTASQRAAAHRAALQGSELFVCGSTSEATRKFVETQRARGIPVFALPPELASGEEFSPAALDEIAMRARAAFEKQQRVILCVGLPQVSDGTIAARLSSHLVTVAGALIVPANVVSIFAEGGATAVELARRMNWSRLTVQREWQRGVVTLAASDDKFFLTVKPGSYVWPEALPAS